MLLHDVEACGAQVNFNKFPNSFSEKKTTHTSTAVPIIPVACYGCGRNNHKKTDCALKAHEDWNTENKSWPLSSKGIAWKAKNALVLPFNASLSGNAIPKFKYTPKTSELNTIALDDHVNDAVLLANILINNILLPITCLIDTGALQANYISREVAESLKAYGLQFCKCNSVVCLAIHNKCSNVKEEVNFKLKFLNELTFQYDIIQVTAKLVNNLNYDVIIGLPTIRQYNLLTKFPKRFYALSLNSQRSPVEHSYSSSQKAITELSELMQLNHKSKQDVLDQQDDDDDIESYLHDTPWDSLMNAHDNDNNNHNNDINFKLPEIHGSVSLQAQLVKLIYEYEDIFSVDSCLSSTNGYPK
jgi:hypothetical protein